VRWFGRACVPMAPSLSLLSSFLFVVSAVLMVTGLSIFIRNVVKKDIAFESLCPCWVRFFLYAVTFAVVPPVGLFTGLGLLAFSKQRELRRFARGAAFASLTFLLFHVALYLTPSSLVQ